MEPQNIYSSYLDTTTIYEHVMYYGTFAKYQRSGTPWSHKIRDHSFPLVTGDGFRAFADVIIDTINDMPSNECIAWSSRSNHTSLIIFVTAKFHVHFFQYCFSSIQLPIVLITHNGDESVPSDQIINYLHSPKLIHWYGQNIQILHPKLTPIPLGLENRYNPGHGSVPEILLSMMLNYAPMYPASWALDTNYPHTWTNFNTQTYPLGRERLQKYIKDNQNHNNLLLIKNKGSVMMISEFYHEMTNYAAMVCPRRNGIDTHRAWESLSLGRMIIVESSTIDSIFDELPVIIITKWENLDNEQLIYDSNTKFLNTKINTNKLFLPYW